MVNRGREVRVGLLGAAALLVLVVGIPAALIAFVGYPLPRTAPTQAWLTETVTATLIINILACVVWLVWAHFTVCLLTEWRAVRRGRLPAQVALGGGSQLLARRLVATVLLLAGAATAMPHGGGSSSIAPAAPRTTISQQQVTAQTDQLFAHPSHLHAAPVHHSEPAAHHAAAAHHPAVAAPAVAAHKYYVVQPPHGRRYDSLWDIADRTLKDPLRYKEIFALNKDRVQADGRKLVDANLIQPGWELKLPADASGPGVHVVHAAAPVAKAEAAPHLAATHPAPAHHTPAHHPTRATEHSPTAAHTTTVRAESTPILAHTLPPVVTAPAHATSPTTTSSNSSLPLGGALMLAGLLVALSAKRGPYGTPTEDESALGLAADPGLALLLDRALRNLAAARSAQHRGLPQPVVAWVSADRVTLNLAGGDAAEPPAPWHLGDDARSWTCGLAEAAGGQSADVAAPFPGLLSVGRHDEYELFVDFEQAPGLISLSGDPEQGRQLAAALAVQAVTSLWSDGARATLVGFGDGAELARVDSRAIRQVSHLSDVLDDLVHEHDGVLRLQRELGVDGVLTGRQSRRSALWQPQLIVLSGPPTPDEAGRLQQLAGGRSNVVVLVVGDTAAARWRFVLHANGHLDLGVLGATATAHRLDRDAVRRLVELVEHAERDGREASRSVAGMTPHRALSSLAPPDLARLDPAAATDPTQTTVAVSLLGPVQVSAPGPLDPARHDLLTEIVVAVALHPEGLHDAVLRASIWPRGVSDQVCAAAMSDAAAWLGHDGAGRACLAMHDGRWRLSAAVRTDWLELRRLAETSAGPHERDALLAAVDLFTGEAFSATPAGRYGWLAFARAAREARLVGTAVVRRAAALLLEQDRPDKAEEVLRRGLLLVPTAELLWRELMTVASRRGPDGPAAAGAVAEDLYATLGRHHAWPEPETDALVAQLAPDRGINRTG